MRKVNTTYWTQRRCEYCKHWYAKAPEPAVGYCRLNREQTLWNHTCQFFEDKRQTKLTTFITK